MRDEELRKISSRWSEIELFKTCSANFLLTALNEKIEWRGMKSRKAFLIN